MNIKHRVKFKKSMLYGCFLLFTIIFVVFQTYTLYVSEKNIAVKNDFVSEYNQENINVLAYLDGQPSKTIPLKNSEYAVDNITCDNNSQGYWNYENWQLNLKNLTKTNTKCKIYFVKQYKETILNGTDPIISENLVPVTIESNGVVKKADRKTNWYSYEQKVWANAIILSDETKNYQNGEVIPESNIESYFVWIPKYKYKLWDLGTYSNLSTRDFSKKHSIDIVFGLDNTADTNNSCKTPMKSGESGNCKVGSYMTHPAFISIPSNGMWVGKFETGYKDAGLENQGNHNVVDVNQIIIKPNSLSWGGIDLSHAFFNSYNYQRDLESHTIKNTEWGSIAYLTFSKYGQGVSPRLNNYDSGTGYAAATEPTCGYTGQNEECSRFVGGPTENSPYTKPYNTDIGVLASTTGNISGIYDMSGGYSDFVMDFMLDITNTVPVSGRESLLNSGFNGPFSEPSVEDIKNNNLSLQNGFSFPNDKYYDVYTYQNNSNNNNLSRRILGDATGEFGPIDYVIGSLDTMSRVKVSWNDNIMEQYHSSTYPIGNRGYSLHGGYNSGILSFQGAYGSGGCVYRIVLSLS